MYILEFIKELVSGTIEATVAVVRPGCYIHDGVSAAVIYSEAC